MKIKQLVPKNHPFMTLTSSTAIVPLLRKKLTKIAKPIAASAAATVKTNSVNTWPTRSFMKLEKATRLMFTERSISSIDINKIMTFLRFKKRPKIPMTKSAAATVR